MIGGFVFTVGFINTPPNLTELGMGVLGLGGAAFLGTLLVAFGYRWYFREAIAKGTAALLAISIVALYLNTETAIAQVIEGQTELLAPDLVLFNTVSFITALVLSTPARIFGDRLARSTTIFTGSRELEGEVNRFVQAVGRVLTIHLPADPAEIDDIEGYDPVDPSTKQEIAGKTLVFPRGLTIAQLHTRISQRLKDDYAIGYVDVEVDETGAVQYLALGRRRAGLGPTLAPGTAAAAIQTDPPNAASTGDIIQLWSETEGGFERTATGELRGVAGDTVTIVLEETEAERVVGEEYRLLTLPIEPRIEREFASILRNADETMVNLPITAESRFAETQVGSVPGTVLAVKPESEPVVVMPDRTRKLVSGDLVYVLAHPSDHRDTDFSTG